MGTSSSKGFNSISTQTTHNLSKKHKETVLRAAANVKAASVSPPPADLPAPVVEAIVDKEENMDDELDAAIALSNAPAEEEATLESSGDPKLDRLIAKRIVSSPPIPTTTCLFCPVVSATSTESALHMRHNHSFVIPDEEYLVNLDGLLKRLGEEVGTWNVCVCCGKGYGGNINLNAVEDENLSPEEIKKRSSKGVEAVRKHMKDKVSMMFTCYSFESL